MVSSSFWLIIESVAGKKKRDEAVAKMYKLNVINPCVCRSRSGIWKQPHGISGQQPVTPGFLANHRSRNLTGAEVYYYRKFTTTFHAMLLLQCIGKITGFPLDSDLTITMLLFYDLPAVFFSLLFSTYNIYTRVFPAVRFNSP